MPRGRQNDGGYYNKEVAPRRWQNNLMVAKPTVLVLLVVLSVYGRSLDFSSTLNRSLSCLVLLPQYVTSADEVWHPLVDLDDAPMKHVYSDRGTASLYN